MDKTREQLNACSHSAASHLADLEGVRDILSVASVTVNGRNTTVTELQSETSQLRGGVGRLTSEVDLSHARLDNLDMSPQRIVDTDVEVDRLCKASMSVRDLLDSVLDGLGGQC